MRWKAIGGVVLLIGVAAAAAIQIYGKPYHPDASALEAMRGGHGITVTDSKRWIAFEPLQVKQPDVILYPGAWISPESYAPLASLLADRGYRTWIVKMPFELAVFGVERAADIMEMNPKQPYVIGGHSLGGAMAARYAAKHPDSVHGIFFLAAYADQKGSIRETKLAALSITGKEDGVLNRQAYEEGKAYLPESTVYEEIKGGNHAGFGSYGMQKGDRPSRLKPDEQEALTADMLSKWMNTIVTRSSSK
ncbi:alpha/beta fold hydrolase [Paenibacillus sp. H1-7]|uniref:alpha/beta fold hydrolase n=1 Tax=Paenibacillus sp. H1-7 TaxID=2282849 RepID=UPI001EF79DFD|nr:alpha/beta fold hydrolase [Paenibacillus sp. H1-7]